MNKINFFKTFIYLLLTCSLFAESESSVDKKSLLKLRYQIAKEQRTKHIDFIRKLEKESKDNNLSTSSYQKYFSDAYKISENISFSDIKIVQVRGKYVILSYPNRRNLEDISEVQAIYFHNNNKWINIKFQSILPRSIVMALIDNDNIPDFIGFETCCSIMKTEFIFSNKKTKKMNDLLTFKDIPFNITKGKCNKFKIKGIEFYNGSSNGRVIHVNIFFDCKKNILKRKILGNYNYEKKIRE